jgi:hypothetical protein
MQAITTIGLDIAKSVFQVHGVDAEGSVIVRRRLKRRYVLAQKHLYNVSAPALGRQRVRQRRTVRESCAKVVSAQ